MLNNYSSSSVLLLRDSLCTSFSIVNDSHLSAQVECPKVAESMGSSTGDGGGGNHLFKSLPPCGPPKRRVRWLYWAMFVLVTSLCRAFLVNW